MTVSPALLSVSGTRSDRVHPLCGDRRQYETHRFEREIHRFEREVHRFEREIHRFEHEVHHMRSVVALNCDLFFWRRRS